MDKFSVIAILVVVGLCLLTLPAEGYVSGYRFTDMSDLGLHYTREKRQSQQDINEQIRKEMEEDGKNADGSKNNPTKEIFFNNVFSHDKEHDQPAKEDQNSEKRAPLTNEHQNNENDINAYNTVADVILILE